MSADEEKMRCFNGNSHKAGAIGGGGIWNGIGFPTSMPNLIWYILHTAVKIVE